MKSPVAFVLSACLFFGHYSTRTTIVRAQECNARTGACDTHERCPVWAEEGECETSARYMKEHCPGSCTSSSAGIAQHQASRRQEQQDESESCEDQIDRCPVWAEVGECDANPDDMQKYCPRSCGLCDEDDDDEQVSSCVDQHDKCPTWAERGECTKNPRYMHEHCAFSCDTCPEEDVGVAVAKKKEAVSKKDAATDVQATKAFGQVQKAEGEQKAATLARMQSTVQYMKSEQVQKLSDAVKTGCLNRHELCTFWQVSSVYT